MQNILADLIKIVGGCELEVFLLESSITNPIFRSKIAD